ncbi:MAG: ribonuclease HI family protein [Candidatus Doudnabacteria bacterium]|nr:ribonuclease HI family protein [Candidatus Doudnabacteria bacterium]
MTGKLTIYTDGGARGNPGPAAVGVVIYGSGERPIRQISEYIGNATNNQAEYKALIRGLNEAALLDAKELLCFLDSELVVRQLIGKYKVKEPELKTLIAEVLRLSNKFLRVDFKHVLRAKNKLADKLVNEALDKAGS